MVRQTFLLVIELLLAMNEFKQVISESIAVNDNESGCRAVSLIFCFASYSHNIRMTSVPKTMRLKFLTVSY